MSPFDSVLPTPEPIAREHSERLASHIHELIERAGGSIGFSQFMALALYAPGMGYYSAGQHRFGVGGDFVTAPELTPLFAMCLARQIAEVFNHTGTNQIFELGAGSGRLAADLIAELSRLGAPPSRYLILELSADLREQQRARLAEFGNTVDIEWVDAIPDRVAGVVVANEVLDAMPVALFEIDEMGDVKELCVSSQGTGAERDFEFCAAPGPVALTARVRALEEQLGQQFACGYRSEINLQLPAWLASVADCLAQGLILLVDYGGSAREYYHADRTQGTLLCHYQHRAHSDPLCLPGLQDITADVDFSCLAAASAQAGLHLSGYTSQAHFLLGCGLDQILQEEASRSPDRFARLASKAKTLVLPGEMGERFKVLALTRGMDPGMSLCGFSLVDHRARL